MKTVAAGTFQVDCLALLDEVLAKREDLLITKHGKPVAKLVPVDLQEDNIFGFYAEKIYINGDIIEPNIPLEE